MTDLFDRARPVVDAALKELERVQGASPDMTDTIRDGHRLGSYLVALTMAFTSERHKTTRGLVSDPGLVEVLAIAMAQVLAHAAISFRPMQGGVPVPASLTVYEWADQVVTRAAHQIAHAEAGIQDFNIQFHMTADGRLEETAFDVVEMLKGGK